MSHRVSNIHTCTRQRHSVTVHYYLLCQRHQLPPVIDASHTTPITRDNRAPKLLKLIGWRYFPCFMWVPSIPRTTTQTPGAEPSPIVRYSGTCIIETRIGRGASHPRETYSGTLFQLRNLNPRSTQNTEVVFSINFPNLSHL